MVSGIPPVGITPNERFFSGNTDLVGVRYTSITRISISKCSGAKKENFRPGRDPNQLPPCSQFDIFSSNQLGQGL
jgi:hypothetical protein